MLSSRAVALWAALVAVASLSTLVVIVSVQDVDTLSTVALTLAVLAFVVQIVIFIFQSIENIRTAGQSRELHGQMMALVSKLDERAHGTQVSIEKINVRLLEAVLGKAAKEGLAIESPELARRVVSGLDSGSSAVGMSDGPERDDSNPYPPALPPDRARRIHNELNRPLTPDESSRVAATLDGLDSQDVWWLYTLADDLASSTDEGSPFGPGLGSHLGSDALRERGLTTQIPGWQMETLSDLGQLVGRLFVAGLADDVTEREKLDHFVAQALEQEAQSSRAT